MGSKGSSQHYDVELKIASLNYSGILKSPYEFYENEEIDKEKLNEVFKKTLQNSELEFTFGNLDKHWQTKRYSPLYREDCGIKHQIQMMNKSEFITEWNKYRQSYEKSRRQEEEEKVEKVEKSEKEQKDMDNLLKFDLLMYKTQLLYIYGEENSEMSLSQIEQTKKQRAAIQEQFQNLDTNLQAVQMKESHFELPAKKYRKHREKMFSKAYLSEKEKNKKVISILDRYDLDVFFLQESSPEVIKFVEKKKNNYRIVKFIGQGKNTAAIFIKERKDFEMKILVENNELFQNNINELKNVDTVERKLTDQELRFLNFNQDTVIQAVGNLIFICPHLTSQQGKKKEKKKEKQEKKQNKKKERSNTKQIIQFMMGVIMLKQWFPYCYLIIGGDLNGSINTILRTISSKKSDESNREQLLDFIREVKQEFLDSIPQRSLQQEKEWENCARLLQAVEFHENSEHNYNYVFRNQSTTESNLEDSKQSFTIYITPNETTTSYKKRTSMQAQRSKADILNNGTKDYLISDLPIYDSKVIALDDKIVTLKTSDQDNSTPLLPTDKHPFDHFIVFGRVRVKMPLIRIYDPEYKKKYTPNKLTKEDLEKIESKFK